MDRFEKSKEVYTQLFCHLPKNENDPEFMDILRKFIFATFFLKAIWKRKQENLSL